MDKFLPITKTLCTEESSTQLAKQFVLKHYPCAFMLKTCPPDIRSSHESDHRHVCGVHDPVVRPYHSWIGVANTIALTIFREKQLALVATVDGWYDYSNDFFMFVDFIEKTYKEDLAILIALKETRG